MFELYLHQDLSRQTVPATETEAKHQDKNSISLKFLVLLKENNKF